MSDQEAFRSTCCPCKLGLAAKEQQQAADLVHRAGSRHYILCKWIGQGCKRALMQQ